MPSFLGSTYSASHFLHKLHGTYREPTLYSHSHSASNWALGSNRPIVCSWLTQPASQPACRVEGHTGSDTASHSGHSWHVSYSGTGRWTLLSAESLLIRISAWCDVQRGPWCEPVVTACNLSSRDLMKGGVNVCGWEGTGHHWAVGGDCIVHSARPPNHSTG